MLKTKLLWISVFISAPLWPASLWASAYTDDQYGLRRLVTAMLGAERQPLYAETVERALVQALQKNPRFEFSDRGYVSLKDALKPLSNPTLGEEKDPLGTPLATCLADVAPLGVQGAVLAEILFSGEAYQIRLALVTTKQPEKIGEVKVPVPDPEALDSFSSATRTALAELIKSIPFSATVLTREGYRVVLDRGYPFFHRGMQISVFTMERSAEGIFFRETGVVAILRSEASLSFGRVLTEKGEGLVAPGNKVRSVGDATIVDASLVPIVTSDRSLASLATELTELKERQTIGIFDLSVGPSQITWNNSAAAGGAALSRRGTYLGGSLLGELLLTSRWFADLGLGFASASLAGASGGQSVSLNSSQNTLAAQMGYRLTLPGLALAPMMFVKAGYGRQQFTVDSSSEPLFLTNLTYNGLLLGAGTKVPLSEKFGMGVELQTMLLASVSESPVTSGASDGNISWWDLSLRGYYTLSPTLDVLARLQFLSSSVDFSGTGTRATPLASSSQSSRALSVGISYYY